MRLLKGFTFFIGLLCVIVGTIGVVWVIDSTDMRGNTSQTAIDLTKTVPAAGVKSLDITTDVAEVVFIPSSTNEIKAHFTGIGTEQTKDRWKLDAVTRPDGTLAISGQNDGSNFHIGIDIKQIRDLISSGLFNSKHRLEVTLPQQAYEKIRVHTDTGRIELGDVQASVLDADASTGAISLNSFKGKTLKLTTDTGSVEFKNVSATENVEAHTSTGRVQGSLIELASPVSLHTDTGSVTLAMPGTAPALFNISNDTGSIDLNTSNNIAYESKEKHHIVAKIGAGTQRVLLETSTGSITVNAR